MAANVSLSLSTAIESADAIDDDDDDDDDDELLTPD
jgi:hypothetical protein